MVGDMEYLRNAWYVAMWAKDLGPDALETRTICDEPVVLYRKGNGRPAALADQCSHRFVPLSMGTKCNDGDAIECTYHGLQFDGSGACVKNPHGTGRIPRSLDIKSYDVVEKHTLVWLWMGEQEPDVTLIPDLSYLDEGAAGVVSRREWLMMEADYQLVADNLLDLSHVQYLHRGTLANDGEIPEIEVTMEEDGDTLTITRRRFSEPPGPMFNMMFRNDGQPCDGISVMRWDAPSNLRHESAVFPPGESQATGITVIGTHLLTPATKGRCYYHIAAVRIDGDGVTPADHDDAIADTLSKLRRIAFEDQDKPVLEAQQKAHDRAGGLENLRPVMLSIDSGPLRARRILARLVATEQHVEIVDDLLEPIA